MVIRTMFVYHLVGPDLSVEVFFEKEWLTEQGDDDLVNRG